VNIDGLKGAITIMPNPVINGRITVQMNNISAGRYSLMLYNMLGQKVFYKTIDYQGGSVSQVVELPSAIVAGAYIIKLHKDQKDFTTRIVIQ
jgi:hypothetical protein